MLEWVVETESASLREFVLDIDCVSVVVTLSDGFVGRVLRRDSDSVSVVVSSFVQERVTEGDLDAELLRECIDDSVLDILGVFVDDCEVLMEGE